MTQQPDSIESEDWTATEWPHIPREMIASLRPIWEGYPNHPFRTARLNKVEKQALSRVAVSEEPRAAREVKEHFSIDGADWKKRRDEAMRELLGDHHLQ